MSADQRTGPFWDFVAGRVDPPPIAALLGFDLVAVDPDAGTIEVGFTATDQFRNPVGDVQGGILGAMLDDTLGRAWWRPSVPSSGRRPWSCTPTTSPRPRWAVSWVGPGWSSAVGRWRSWPAS